MPTPKDPVKALYQQFPFPSGSTPHLVQHWTNLLEKYFESEKISLKGKSFLDAGCGTGDNCLSFAENFPELQFEAIDLSDSSVQRAEAQAQKRKLANVHFSQQDILEFESKTQYDFIASLGVLHHTPEPKKGLKKLLAALKVGGHCFIDLYGFYGYLGVRKGQDLLNLLEQDTHKLADRLQIMESLLPTFLQTPVPKEREDPRYIALVDGFVTPYAFSYKIEEALSLLEEQGLRKVRWLDSPKILEGELRYKNFKGERLSVALPEIIQSRLEKLSQKEQYRFFELAFSPFDYFLCGQKL